MLDDNEFSTFQIRIIARSTKNRQTTEKFQDYWAKIICNGDID
jgi:hypothetical protein